MEVAEVANTLFFFVKISHGDVQTHWFVAHSGRIEYARLDLKTRIEGNAPFEHISILARFNHACLSAALDPADVRVPGVGITPRFTGDDASYFGPMQLRLGQVANHLP